MVQKPSRKSWSCYDMFMTVAPGMLLTLVTIAFNLVVCFACLGQPAYIIRRIMDVSGSFILSTVVSFYVGLLVYGLLTVLSEWKQIKLPGWRKLLYVVTFPVFMFTYIPISLAALVQKWSGSPSTTPAVRSLWARPPEQKNASEQQTSAPREPSRGALCCTAGVYTGSGRESSSRTQSSTWTTR